MPRFLDARIPLRIAPAPSASGAVHVDSAWLVEGDAPLPAATVAHFTLPERMLDHATDCACCLPRGPIVQALSRLFLARARGEIAFFRRVIAVPHTDAGAQAIAAALATDPFLAARYRLEPGVVPTE